MDVRPTVSQCRRPAELSDLLDALQSAPKERARYNEALSRIRFGIEAVKKYCHFDPSSYARNLIARTDKFELLALCWEPGQVTPVHDHSGSDGWVYCVQGEIEEVRFQCFASEDGTARVERGEALKAAAGDMTYINDGIAWHTVANQTQERAVTLHLYSGPIDSCQYFDPGTRTIQTRQMKYFSIDGVIRPRKVTS